jgi:hypothetical protein
MPLLLSSGYLRGAVLLESSFPKCRSFDSAEVRFAQDDRVGGWERAKGRSRSFDSAEVRFAQDDRFETGGERSATVVAKTHANGLGLVAV